MVADISILVYTAQGGGASFKDRNHVGEVGPVNHGWQSEPSDGPTSGWRQRSVVEVAVVLVAEM